MSEAAKFWEALALASKHAGNGASESAQRELDRAVHCSNALADSLSRRRVVLIEKLANVYDLTVPVQENSMLGGGETAGVSLVTSCRNRNENLIKALPSWLACSDVSEIVIVDWTSERTVSTDLNANGFNDPRIRVVRVENEPRWILAYPFNLGFQFARFDKILKVDADIVIEPDFFVRNTLKRSQFIAGNWRTASEGQGFVNGFFYVWRRALTELAGFNEYITTYGWDDEELYGRLMEQGLERHDVASDCIFHLPHDDDARTEKKRPSSETVAVETLPADTTFLIRRNRHIANMLPAWNKSRPVALYEIVEDRGQEVVLRRQGESGVVASDAIQREAFLAAARELLAWRIGDRCYEVTLDQMEQLIGKHAWQAIDQHHIEELARVDNVDPRYSTSSAPIRDVGRARAEGKQAPAVHMSRDKIYIDGQHGLGNRLRAIGSASAIAEATDRELVIVWEADAHCDCKFTDLFEYDGPVIDESFYKNVDQESAVLFNYMDTEDGAQKDQPIELVSGTDAYLRSAFVFRHPASDWTRENKFLHQLLPVESVTALMDRVSWPNDVSAHIRMQGGKQYEHLAWEAADNWSAESHQLVAEWRQKSHFSNFIRHIDKLVEAGEANTIFIAADLSETYAEFSSYYGDRVRYLDRAVDDRSLEQLRYALADALLLSRSTRMLGSTWSSFSELAMRLAIEPMKVEMSGTDF